MLKQNYLILFFFLFFGPTFLYAQNEKIPHCPSPSPSFTQEGRLLYTILQVEVPPRFTFQKDWGSNEDNRKAFAVAMKNFVKKNVDVAILNAFNLNGVQRIYIKFVITNNGNVTSIQARAQHPALEQYAIAIFKKLPQFIPAKHLKKNVDVAYMLPIVFNSN